MDVTQTTMQPILESLGITDRSVKELSQGEKEILRYIATLRQAKIAMGDYANTIESPANQMKVFKQQLVEAKVALTSLFIGGFAKILPYANAFLMVIKEVSKSIASMFGIKITDYNTGIASQEEAYTDLGDSISDATDKVKELKRQTLGFDEINNISENKDSGSESGVAGGGIDKRLLDAIGGYDNGMEKVRMKATGIRDKIMEWLGFTKSVNEETGEISFTYGGFNKTLSNMTKWWKGLNVQGKIFASLGLGLIFVNLYKAIKGIANITGITTLFSNISSVIGTVSSNIGALAGAINPVTIAIGVLLSGLGYVYLTNEQVKESFNEIISTIGNNLKPLFEFISSTVIPNLIVAWDGLLSILSPLGEFVGSIFTSVWNDMLIPSLRFLGETIIPNITKTFENLWKNIFVPLGEFLGAILKPVIEKLSEVLGILWKNVIVPISDYIGGTFAKKWESLYEILNKSIIPIFKAVIDVATWLWKNVLEPITDFLYDVFKPSFESVCNSIGNIFNGLKKIFNGVLDFITGVFTLNWKKAWSGVKNIFTGMWDTLSTVVKTPLNSTLAIFEGFINKIIDGWNWMKKQINSLSIEIPEWIPKVGGEKIGFDLKPSGHVNLEFANGGFPEEGPFFMNRGEIAGKFSNGKGVVANNYQITEGIKQAVMEGMSQILNQNNTQSNQIDVHVHTDEGTIVDRVNQKTKQTGVCPIYIPS